MACAEVAAPAASCEVGTERDGHAFVPLEPGATATAVYGTQGSLMVVLTLRSPAFPLDAPVEIHWTVDLGAGRTPLEATVRRRAKAAPDGVPHIDDLYVVLELVGPTYVPDPDQLISLVVDASTPSGLVRTETEFRVHVEGTPYPIHP